MSAISAMTDGVRPPQQRRAKETWQRLLAAGTELLAERGYEGFTLPEVGKRAGVSNGAMYWRVENKQALLDAIHVAYLERTEARNAVFRDHGAWERLSVGELVDAVTRAIAASMGAESRLVRALVLRAGADPSIPERGSALVRRTADDVRALLTPPLRAAGHPDPEAAVGVMHMMVFNTLLAHIAWPEMHAPDLEWDWLIDHLAAASRAQLLGPCGPDAPQ